LELLRRVHRIEGQRAFRLPQRRRKVAEVRKREAHVVMGFREIRIRLDGASERVARVGVFLEIDQNQTDAVPRHRMLGRRAEHLTVSLQRQLGVLSTKKPQREIETRLDRRVGSLERSPERVYSALGVVLVPTKNAKVVLGEGIAGVDLQRACV